LIRQIVFVLLQGLERTDNVMEAKAAILSILLQREDTMTQAK